MRIVVAMCTAFLLLFVVAPAYSALTPSNPYFVETYSPGEQHGGNYDCPYINRLWVGNGFAKSAARLGKSIFIDNSGGNWIGAYEDATTYTFLYRPDLEGSTKKGSVKNTSAYTYNGGGEQWYEDTHWCV